MSHIEHMTIGAVLCAEGAVLRTTSDALVHQAALRVDDFTDLRARAVWTIVLRLTERRRPANVETVFTFGRLSKAFAEKDIAWLREWENDAATIDRTMFGDMVDGLRSASRAKALAIAYEEAIAALRAPSPDVVKVITDLETVQREALSAMVDETSTGDMDLAELADRWQRVEAGTESADVIPTGIKCLDDLIGGFFSNLNMIIGAPSEGKSAFVATVIELLLLAGVKVGVFGLEDGTAWIQRRHVAKRMGINARDVGRKPRDHKQHERFAEVTEDLAPLMRNLKTYKRGGIRVSKLLQVATRWKDEGVQIMFIDHGGELDHHSEKVDEHRLRVGLSYKAIRDFATANGIPMVAVAHTRRKSDLDTEPRPPRADEVRDASDIENAARSMLGVWQVPGEDCVRITSAKVTEGERYKTVRIAKVAGGVLLDPEQAEVIDLFAEKMAIARKKKEEKEAIRREAREKAAAERAAAKEAKTKGQGGLALGDRRSA